MASTKKNFFYNLILTVGNYIFPLLTFPYVSRVLGVSNIGVCNYVDSIVNYFVIFATLGINIVGVREIARNKDNPEKLQQTFSTLFLTNLLLTIFACVILILCTFYVEQFAPYKSFYCIGLIKLFLNVFSVNWLFQGLSEFKFVTTRSLIIRGLYVLCVFVFIHSTSDTWLFYFLSCVMTIATAVWNWKYSYRFVHFSFKNVNVMMFAAPILSFGLYQILTSMYTSFNVAFLGWTTNTTQVGFYTTATKLYAILLSVFTAFTTVMMPRINELVSKGETERLKYIADQTFELVFIFSLPTIIASYCYAPNIIDIISGKGYEGAIMPFRIVMILILVVALEQIIICQFLMAVTKSNCVTILSAAGALVGVALNLILTPKIMAIGTSISLVASEICMLLCSTYFFKKYYSMNVPWRRLFVSLLCAIPYVIIGYVTMNNALSIIILGIVLMLLWFLVLNFVMRRNDILYDVFVAYINKIKRHTA